MRFQAFTFKGSYIQGSNMGMQLIVVFIILARCVDQQNNPGRYKLDADAQSGNNARQWWSGKQLSGKRYLP